MKYRTKLYLFFLAVCCVGLATAFSIMVTGGYRALFREIQSNAISIAATTAVHLNGDLVEQIKGLEDEQKPAYQEVRQFLRKSRDANRNENIYVKFIYTIYPDPKNPKNFLFGVDAEELEKDLSHAGTANPGATPDLLYDHLAELYSFDKLESDQWGTWLTGYAPVFNSKGQYVATIGVDISASFVYSVMKRLYLLAGVTSILSLLLATLAAFFLSKKASLSLNLLKEATVEIGKGNLSYRVSIKGNDEFHDLGDALNQMAKDLQEKEKIKAGFARYVSKHVMEKILSQETPFIGGQRKKITVFFCDIRDFTQISESLPAEQVMSMLNEYFQIILGIVFKHNGMLDKLIGDAIMAEFGYPVDDPEQEKNAVLTALEMQQAVSLLRVQWRKEGKPEFDIGIGIHTGEAVLGTLGSEERFEFTAIGDTVNIASRLESATRELNEKIIVSEETMKPLGTDFRTKPLGPIQLKGIKKPINAFAILPLE